MATVWVYGLVDYDTKAEAEAAVLVMKNKLDNNPTEWCVVTEVTPSQYGWAVGMDEMTDAEILAIDTEGWYFVHSPSIGTTDTGLNAADTKAKINHYRRLYAQEYEVNTITRSVQDDDTGLVTRYPETVTNADMSVYLD